MKILAVLLIILGILGIGWGGFRYAYPDKVVDAGPVQVSVTRYENFPIPPILGIIALIGGIGMLAVDRRKAA